MKILAIGDLHGQKPRISKSLDFDALICIGDVCSDREIAPFYKKWFAELKKREITFEDFLSERIGKKEFEKMEKRSLIAGRKVLEYLNSLGKPVFIVPGNWDQSYGETRIKDRNKNDYNYLRSFLDWWLGDKINQKLVKGLKNIKDCHYKNDFFNGFNFVGYGLSSGIENPRLRKKLKKTSRDKIKTLNNVYKKIIQKLEDAYEKREKNFPVIFISHNVPYKTKLDIIKDKKSIAYKKHRGSSVAREFIEKHKPLICISGHIHEGKGRTKIGKTSVINIGFGKKAQVFIDIDEERERIKNVKFVK